MRRGSIVALLLLFSCSAFAGQGTFGRFGLGFGAPDQKSISENKFVSLGYQDEFSGPIINFFDYKYEVGGWSDASKRAGRKSNAFVSASIGLEPNLGWFYVHSFVGVAAVATTDSTLGSVPQFVEDIGLGIQDSRKRRMGVGYKHFSNAGIWSPNKGRDFITIMMQIPW